MSPSTARDAGARLLAALERTGPQPVLAWYGEAARIELSGHVLANWVIKTIGHLDGELALAAGDELVLDLSPHWKRLVLALAAWSLGASTRTAGDDSDQVQVVATDHPDSELAEGADEVLALQAVSLAPRYDGELPPLAHDWLGEVRGSSDRLGVALPGWSGPAAAPEPEGSPSHGERMLVEEDGLRSAAPLLALLLAGGGLVGPAAAVTERQAQEEAVTGRLPRS